MIFTILGKNNESIGQSLFHTNKPYQINMFLSYIFMVEFMNDVCSHFVISFFIILNFTINEKEN